MLPFIFTALLGSPAALAADLPAARYTSEPRASYPMSAAESGFEADCRVRVIADERGRPVRADIDLESQPEGACPEPFRTQAIYASWSGRLAPVSVGGEAVAFTFVQSVIFAPHQEPEPIESLDALVDAAD